MSSEKTKRDEQRDREAHRDLPARAVFGELWRSKMVKLALLVVLVGGGLWVYSAMNGPSVSVSTSDSGGSASGGVGLPGVGWHAGAADAGPAVGAGRSGGWAGALGPKMAGGGVSFIGAYGLGWLFRRFLKIAAIIVGLGVAGVAGLSGMGVLSDDDTAKVRDKLKDGGAWVQDNAGAFKDRAMAILPSSAAALGGLFVGFRKS